MKLRPELGVLRLSNMPAVLNEGAFVDNQKDVADWNEDHELKKLGEAYAMAAAEFLGLEKKVATPVPAPVESNVVYRVQVGAYNNLAYAEDMLKKLEKAGFPGIITKVEK